MDIRYAIQELQANHDVWQGLLRDADPELRRWRPEPGKWNLHEVLCHLYDEERDDFRARLRSVLEDPQKALEPIDPQGWVLSREYDRWDYDTTLQDFLAERDQSLAWLNSLGNAPWSNTHQHPRIGPMSTTFILSNWVAHDLLHIRQVIRMRYDYLKFRSGVSLPYAGDW